jgi:hypothetical protein
MWIKYKKRNPSQPPLVRGGKIRKVPLIRGIRGLYYFFYCYRLQTCHSHTNLKKEKELAPMDSWLDPE